MEPEVRKAPVRFYEIDLLRFVAALSVVFYHYTYRGYGADNYSPIPFLELGKVTRYGYLGVELFFIISGYVILLSAQGKTVKQFFLSRVTRLYPAFWIACTLTFVVERIWGTGPADAQMASMLHAEWGNYFYNMTMLHEFLGITAVDGVYWSLTVEITFYFLIALLIGFKLMRHLNLFLVLWLLYSLWSGINNSTRFAYLFFPRLAPYFAAGMLFYLLQKPQNRTWQRYALLASAYLLAIRSGLHRAFEQTATFHSETSPVIVVTAITCFFLIFLLITFRKINFSRFNSLAWLGTLTYPLYLIHENIGFVGFYRLQQLNKYVLLGGAVVIMIVVSHLIHVLVEKPFHKPLGKFIDKWLLYIDNKQEVL